MPLIIKKPPVSGEDGNKNNSTTTKVPSKTNKNPKSTKKRGTKAKGGKDQLNKLKGLEATLEKYHAQTDEDLLLAIQPSPENADKPTHRLEDHQLEARMVLLHRLMIRKVPPADIAKQLGVSIAMYYKLREQLNARLRLDVNKVDVPYLIGDTLAFYDEVRSMALNISSSSSVQSVQTKVAAMGVALKAEADKNDFLTKCGVYSAPVVEHIVRGMVSTGQFNVVDGEAQRVSEAKEVNTSLAHYLKQQIIQKLQLAANPESDSPVPQPAGA